MASNKASLTTIVSLISFVTLFCVYSAKEGDVIDLQELLLNVSATLKDVRKTMDTLNYPCPKQFDCGDGHCIDREWICDGENDCDNFEDEKNCKSCAPHSFYCGKSKCIRDYKVCDGIADCPDSRDEKNCSYSPCPKQFDCGDGHCVDREWVCDGENDCNNFQDEKNCTSCAPRSFYCGKWKCIRDYKVCDGIADCPDSRDEKNCSCNSTKEASNEKKPRDCADLWLSGVRVNGIYRVWPEKWEKVGSFEVYCDMVTDGGGWTVFQKRGDYGFPVDFFFKTWVEYKNGFGELGKEFWLGNDRIFALTNQDTYKLRIDLWDLVHDAAYAKFDTFWIENEDQRYKLKLSGYSGNAGDDLCRYSGMAFTTRDRDHDIYPDGNCAELYKGGWWYKVCHSANLNGLNLRGPHASYADGIEWDSFRGHHYSLAATEMKIRPVGFTNHL